LQIIIHPISKRASRDALIPGASMLYGCILMFEIKAVEPMSLGPDCEARRAVPRAPHS
jgi:hypothetical protein